MNAIVGPARELPFRDRWFDLVFTMGVLIHQPPQTLPLVMAEIVRCSRRYVLCGEYFAEKLTEVPYRGQTGALFKRDFGGMYEQLFPELELRKTGFLSQGRRLGRRDLLGVREARLSMHRVFVVQARMTSRRLPGKMLTDLGGRPMLSRQLERLRRYCDLDRIVVATTTNATDDPVVALAERIGGRCVSRQRDATCWRGTWAPRALSTRTSSSA